MRRRRRTRRSGWAMAEQGLGQAPGAGVGAGAGAGAGVGGLQAAWSLHGNDWAARRSAAPAPQPSGTLRSNAGCERRHRRRQTFPGRAVVAVAKREGRAGAGGCRGRKKREEGEGHRAPGSGIRAPRQLQVLSTGDTLRQQGAGMGRGVGQRLQQGVGGVGQRRYWCPPKEGTESRSQLMR